MKQILFILAVIVLASCAGPSKTTKTTQQPAADSDLSWEKNNESAPQEEVAVPLLLSDIKKSNLKEAELQSLQYRNEDEITLTAKAMYTSSNIQGGTLNVSDTGEAIIIKIPRNTPGVATHFNYGKKPGICISFSPTDERMKIWFLLGPGGEWYVDRGDGLNRAGQFYSVTATGKCRLLIKKSTLRSIRTTTTTAEGHFLEDN